MRIALIGARISYTMKYCEIFMIGSNISRMRKVQELNTNFICQLFEELITYALLCIGIHVLMIFATFAYLKKHVIKKKKKKKTILCVVLL